MRRHAILIVSLLCLLVGTISSPAGVVPRQQTRKLTDHVLYCLNTLVTMRSIQTAVEAYRVDHPGYPVAHSLTELKAFVEPTYIRVMPTVDPWGTEFRYIPLDGGKGYMIVSAGSDRTFDESSWNRTGLLDSSADDAVLASSGHGDREWIIQQ